MAAAARTRDYGSATASPKSDAYVGLLGISLVALIIGCVLLFLDWNEYPQTKPPAVTPYAGMPKAGDGGGSGGGGGGGGAAIPPGGGGGMPADPGKPPGGGNP